MGTVPVKSEYGITPVVKLPTVVICMEPADGAAPKLL